MIHLKAKKLFKTHLVNQFMSTEMTIILFAFQWVHKIIEKQVYISMKTKIYSREEIVLVPHRIINSIIPMMTLSS